MKVLCFTENLGSGGAERQLTGLAVMLRERGYDVLMVTYLDNPFYLPYLEQNGVAHRLLAHAGNKFSRLYYLYKMIRDYRPDAVVSYLPGANMAVCLVRLLIPFRLIVSERSATLKVTFRDRIRFFLYRRADYLVANSCCEAARLRKRFDSLSRKTVAITNFVDTDTFRPADKQPNRETLSILCVGRITASKNVLGFMDAVRIVLDKGFHVNVVWIGSHYDRAYCREAYQAVERLGLTSCVTIREQTSDLLPFYQAADLFCLPSLMEGYPNVICEAMSCGLPVLCSDVCENPTIVAEGVNGFLFDPLKVSAMVRAIERFIGLPVPDRVRMGEANRCKMQNNNSMDVFARRYIELLRS